MARLNTTGDLVNEVLVELNANTSLAYYTDTILMNWVSRAHTWAAGFHKWPFTEGTSTTTYVSSTELYDYPEGWKSDSIRLLQLGGKRLQKVTIEDYQIFRDEQPTAKDRIWADFGAVYYINPNVDASGTITAWGQFVPAAFDNSRTDELTVFSNREEEGNEAIVQKIISMALVREKTPTGFVRGKAVSAATLHESNAVAILEGIWQRYKDEQYLAQTKHGLFKRIDVLRGGLASELFRRDQFL